MSPDTHSRRSRVGVRVGEDTLPGGDDGDDDGSVAGENHARQRSVATTPVCPVPPVPAPVLVHATL